MTRKIVLLLALGTGLGSACGSEQHLLRLPYDPDKTAIIGRVDEADGLVTNHVVTTPNGDECIDLDDVCATPQSECGDDGAADVLLDESGAVVDVICYPTQGVAIERAEGDLAQVGNNVVLVLDDVADGVDVAGDVTIDGNNVTLYGHGPETSVIGGDLNIDKNNALVRGVTVEGNVTIDKNNPSIVNCVIEGDLTIRGNNVSIALCEVWGKLTIEGNNAVLVGNHFASAPVIKGQNTVCNSNRHFVDENDDHAISQDELGDTVACAEKAEDK